MERKLLPHEESDDVLYERIRERFYRMLSNFDLTNENLISSECFQYTPVCERFPITYPLQLLLEQDSPTRLVNMRLDREDL